MTSQPSDVEILVHVAAPSRASDDAVYRQLAQSYLDFRPQRRSSLPWTDAVPVAETDIEQLHEQQAAVSSQDFVAYAPPRSFEINSQDMSFGGALDNRFSPRLRTDKHATTWKLAGSFSQESGIGS